MKKILIGLSFISLLGGGFSFGVHAAEPREELQGTITLSGAWALYPMAVKWAEEFQKIHPEVKIDIAAGGAGKGMADALARVVDIGMVSREIYPEEVQKGAWSVSVVKDAVVPTINAKNPFIEELLAQGVTREIFKKIWITGEITNWEEVVGQKKARAMNVYTRSDACGAAQTWAQYLDGKQEDLLGVGVYGDPGLAEAVARDVLGVGFNNINFIYDGKTKNPVPGIVVLPIDINANGRVDPEERFYQDRDQIVGAIAEGRYPSPPARDLHFVTSGRTQRKAVEVFIRWVLTEGQRFVPEAGYINLPDYRLREGITKLEQQ